MIAEEIQFVLDDARAQMKKSLEHLSHELNSIRAGRATPSMLDNIMVDYYGSSTPLNQVASVNSPSPDLLIVQAWDKSVTGDIERAIIAGNLGLNPSNDGDMIRIPVPPLSEERRRDLVKTCRHRGEDVKVSIRNIRRHARDVVKRVQKDEKLPEDMRFEGEEQLEVMTHEFTEVVDKALDRKEVEILEV
jgi:ribosome recycling factor